MRALIVDDSAVMRKVIERALRQAGLDVSEVVEAANGSEALQVLRDRKDADTSPDVIFSDIHMPVMDGLTFLEGIRRENLAPDVPVVMVTTEGSEQLVIRAVTAGARGYICKPFTAEQMRARIVPLLRRSTDSSPTESYIAQAASGQGQHATA